MAALFSEMLWTAARIGSSLVECEKLTCRRGSLFVSSVMGLCSCTSSVLLPHRRPGFRSGAEVISCSSEDSATVEEEIRLRKLEIFVSSSLETLEML